MEIMHADRRTANIEKDDLKLIFDRLQEKVQKRDQDEKNAATRHRRRNIDALRHRIKTIEPRVRVTDTYDELQPRIEKLEEYRELDDEGRRAAFDKYITRLKEREEEEKERERRRARRNEDREHRNGHRESRHGRLSKTPEADPYAADRRKAIAARERQYRRPSVDLSPPPTSYRDHRDRDERHGRLEHNSPGRLVSYDREARRDRRDGEEDRERLYRTRADPRSSRDELNYGEDARSTTSDRRRRRETPDEAVDDARRKRYRRDSRGPSPRRRTKTPEAKKEVEESAGVHSGSEEGEIEED